MTGAEHYKAAEKALADAAEMDDPSYYLAKAQVHATLALCSHTYGL